MTMQESGTLERSQMISLCDGEWVGWGVSKQNSEYIVFFIKNIQQSIKKKESEQIMKLN